MHRSAIATAVVSLTLVACAIAPEAPSAPAEPPSARAEAPAPPAPPAPERVKADATRTLPGGGTYVAPRGWTLLDRGAHVVLTAPEGDLQLVVAEVRAADGDAAVAEAWRLYAPGAQRPVERATSFPGRDGWQEARSVRFRIAPEEKRAARAIAYRAGESWTVLVVDGSTATLQRRSGPVSLVAFNLHPPGYAPESVAGRTPHRLDAARLAQLRDFVAFAARETGVPGVGFAIIEGGKTVYAGGTGVLEAGQKRSVDADTLFMAGSNTKGMTTALLARLVEQGKLRWDQPAAEVLPGLRVGDAARTAQVQVRHLVCACTGLPAKDLEWHLEYANATPRSLVEFVGTIEPTTGFGETYQYSNALAAVAGYVAAYAADPTLELGAGYDAAMARELFGPLGMRRTTLDMRRALRDPNHASAHVIDPDGRARPLPRDAVIHAVVNVRPAGGVWTSARDFARYVEFELASGRLPDGRQHVSRENMRERYRPQVTLSAVDHVYGMGLDISRSLGVELVHHGGGWAGHRSDMNWWPELGAGLVVLTNSDHGVHVMRAARRRMLELLFDLPPQAEEDVRTAAQQLREAAAARSAKLAVPADPEAARALAAHYRHETLGSVQVRTERGQLVFDFGEWKSAIGSQRNPDGTTTFSVLDAATSGIELVTGPPRNGLRTLVILEGQHERVFVEVPVPQAAR